jgi:hypothetical protein
MRLGWALAHLRQTIRVTKVTKGRLELPRRIGHDGLSVACLPVTPLGRVSMTRAGIEPAFAA